MASPATFQRTSTEQGSTDVYAAFTAGSSGAVGTFTEDSGAFDTANVTRISAGLYKFPLREQWSAKLEARPSVTRNGVAYSASDGSIGHVFQDNVACQSNKTIAHHSSDAVVDSTKTWTLGNGTFTAADVGATLKITGSATSDGTYTIASVTSGTVVVTTAGPGADETLASSTVATLTDVPYIAVLFVKADSSAAANPTQNTTVELAAVLKWDGP